MSDSIINAALDVAELNMFIVNTYFDFDDYKTPVKSFFDDSFFYKFASGFNIENSIYIKQNSYSLQDSIWRYSPDGIEGKFIGN